MPADNTKSEMKDMRRELAELRKEVARLRKDLEALQKPGRIRGTVATVEGLEVLGRDGEVTAALDHKGHLYCKSIQVGAERKGPGVLIEGGGTRRISAGRIELAAPGAKTPGWVAEADTEGGAGTLHLCNPGGKQRLVLQGAGTPVTVHHNQTGEATFRVSSDGHLQLRGSARGGKARAVIGVNESTQSGAILLTDGKNKTVAKLPAPPPPRFQGILQEPPQSPEHAKSSTDDPYEDALAQPKAAPPADAPRKSEGTPVPGKVG